MHPSTSDATTTEQPKCLLSRRRAIQLAVGSLVPAVFGGMTVAAETATRPAGKFGAGPLLRDFFQFNSSTAQRLLASPKMLSRCDALWEHADAKVLALRDAMAAQLPQRIDKLRKGYQAQEPDFGFGARSLFLDCVVANGLLNRAGQKSDVNCAALVGATMDLVAALGRAGKKTVDLHVGQASNMMPLAVAYDWLYPHFSAAQRKQITAAMLDYSVRPTLEALYGYDGRAWWVTGMNNWTTICIGGAVAAVLALRAVDDPGPFAAQTTADGQHLTRSFVDHADELLRRGLENLRRPLIQLASNNGLWGEGPGYQHDAMLPWFVTIASVESALARPERAPAVVKQFIADGHAGAAAHVRSSLHLASPLGDDFVYSDGTWGLTAQPINLLIADYARQAGNPQWRAAAWLAAERGGHEDLGMHLLFRSLFDWKSGVDTPRGMANFDVGTAPTAVYFFDHKAALPVTDAPVPNPHVAIWRQKWTDCDAAAVMFKGGDNRMDYHSHLDVGSFSFDSQGVRWAVDVGRADGYVPYVRDGLKGYQPNGVVFFQPYAKRACGHNTLVVNSAVNDYTNRAVPEPWTWLWQINPDQALLDPDAWSAVGEVQTAEGDPTWSAAVDLSPVYRRHGMAAGSKRRFEFDRQSGALTITDTLVFDRPSNDVWWFMHLAATTEPVHVMRRRIVFGAMRPDKTPVYCELALLAAPTTEAALVFDAIDQNLPPGQPADLWLWGQANGVKMKRDFRKAAVHLSDVGRSVRLVTRLRPLPEYAGKSREFVKSAVAADGV